MKNKTLAFILIILCLIIILNFKLLITGLVTLSEQLGIGLSIASVMQGDIIALSSPNYIVQNDSAIILSTFQNTGNQNLSEMMGIYIINSNGTTVSSTLDYSYTLSPLETRTFMITWEPNELGNFTIIANASYDGKIAQKNKTVSVVTFIPTTTTTTPSGGGGGGRGGIGGGVMISPTTTTVAITKTTVTESTSTSSTSTTTLKFYESVPLETGVQSFLIIIVIIIIIAVMIIMLLFAKRRKDNEWEKLYKKWKDRKK